MGGGGGGPHAAGMCLALWQQTRSGFSTRWLAGAAPRAAPCCPAPKALRPPRLAPHPPLPPPPQVAEVAALHDPCPLPDKQKKRGLNERERLLYAPMSGARRRAGRP